MAKSLKRICLVVLTIFACTCFSLLLGQGLISSSVYASVVGLENTATLKKVSATNGYTTGTVEYLEFDGLSGDTYFMVEFSGKNAPNFAVNADKGYSTWNAESLAVPGVLLSNSCEAGQHKLIIGSSLNTKGTHNSNIKSFPEIGGYAPGLLNFDENGHYLMIIGYDKTGVLAQNFSVYIFIISSDGTIVNVYDRTETINARIPSGNKAIIYPNINHGNENITFNYQAPESTLDQLIEGVNDNCTYKKQLQKYFYGTQKLDNSYVLNRAQVANGVAENVEYLAFDGMGGDTFFMVEFTGKNVPNFALRAKRPYSDWNGEKISDAGILLSQSFEYPVGEGSGNALKVNNGINTTQVHASITSASNQITNGKGLGLDNFDNNSNYLMIIGAEYHSKHTSSTAVNIKVHFYLYTITENTLTQVGKYVGTHGVLKPSTDADVAVIYPNINYGAEFVSFNYVKPQASISSLINALPDTSAYKEQLKTEFSVVEQLSNSASLSKVTSASGVADNVDYLEFEGFEGNDAYFLVEFTGKNIPNFTVCANNAYSKWNKETYATAGYSLFFSSTSGADRAYLYSGVSTGIYNSASTELWSGCGLNDFESGVRYLMLVGYDRVDAKADVFSVDVYTVNSNGTLTEFISVEEQINVSTLKGDKVIIYPNVNHGLDSINFNYVNPSNTISGLIGNVSDDCPYKEQLIQKYGASVSTVNVIDENGNTIAKVGAESGKEFILPKNEFGLKNFIGWQYNGQLYLENDRVDFKSNQSIKAVCIDYQMVNGASIRVSQSAEGFGGLRFSFKVNTEQFNAVKNNVKVYGMIMPTDMIEGDFDLGETTPKELTKSLVKNDGYTYFNMVLTNILLSNYNREFSAKAYFEITYSDGTTKVFETEYNPQNHSRSVYSIAKDYYNYVAENGANISSNEMHYLKVYLDNTVNLNFSIVDGKVNFSTNGVADGLDESYEREYSVIDTSVSEHSSGAQLVNVRLNIDVPEMLISSDGTPHLSLTLWAGKDNSKRINAYVSSYDSVNNVANLQTLIYCNPEFYYESSKSVFELFGYSGTCDDWYIRNGKTTMLPESLTTNENIKLYKDSGLNVLFVGNSYNYSGRSESFEDSDLKKVMDLAHANGLKCIIFEEDIHALSRKTYSLIGPAESGKTKFATQEKLVEYVRTSLAEVSLHPAFYGLSLDDEPSYNQFDAMGEVYRAIQTVVPGAYVNMNLWAYAQGWAFNTDNIYCSNYDDFTNPEDVYREYLRLFNEKVGSGMIMYDDYPLYEKINLSTGEPVGQTGVLANHILTLRLVAEFCEENNLQFNKVFQTSSYTEGTTTKRRAPTEADMYWQLNLGMALNVEHFSYWTYYPLLNTASESYNPNACYVDTYGNPNPIYYTMQKIHSEMQVTAKALKNFSYLGMAMYKNGTIPGGTDYINNVLAWENDEFTKLSSVTLNNNGAVLVSERYDENFEQYGYFVVNAVEPTQTADQRVTLTFNGYNNVLIYKYGKIEKIELDNGLVTLDLPVGHGAFVLPY